MNKELLDKMLFHAEKQEAACRSRAACLRISGRDKDAEPWAQEAFEWLRHIKALRKLLAYVKYAKKGTKK